ncbi:MAG TPA: hypothetical protein VLK84_10020 [Longimicrobium sp.]|nr:hypothetical protein [Longimicrobium sp.]
MTMVRRALRVIALFLLLFVVSHASTRGPLFPWSPVRPGYAAETFPGATVVYPRRDGMPDAYRRAETILADVARANGLAFRAPVTIVVTDDWTLFNCGGLLRWNTDPLPVLGAALQTGTVVYVSPLALEPGRDREAVLRHELTHALMFQQMPLRRTFALVRLDWFEEGLAVRAGNPGDYLDDAAWGHMARHPAYRFGPGGDPELRRVPAEMRGSFRLAEYRVFMEYLAYRLGHDRFFAFRDDVLCDPEAVEGAFVRAFGAGFAEVVAGYERAVRAGAWPRG